MAYFRIFIKKAMASIVIFGSGKGSNARRLLEHFKNHKSMKVAALVSNKPRRGFLDISYDYKVNLEIIKGDELSDPKWIAHLKLMYRPDIIVLAGYLKLIPTEFIQAFPGKIVNLHPSLLPRFGGRGMYGNHVHQAVIDSGDQESGITVHYVNEEYDKGMQLFQATCPVFKNDTALDLANRIHELEYEHFPKVIESLLS
jgi:phosphoribosylglycinamide formyltransferase-1